jgi:hypothetical protein
MTILALVAVVLFSLFFIVTWKFQASLEPSSDIGDYQTALESVPVELVEHFPHTVSSWAKSKFFYRPGFLQGGTSIQLKLDVDIGNIQKLRAKYGAKAVKRWQGCARSGSSAEFMPRMQRTTASASVACDYDMYVLRTTPEEDWNHGYESGIAFSEKRREVLYWAKTW